MNEIQLFKNERFGEIKVFKNNEDNIYFKLEEICEILDLKNIRDIYINLDDDEKFIIPVKSNVGYTDSPFQGVPSKKERFVNESGFYSLVFKSKKDEAKIFKKWVTSEVLPQIRKTGSYGIQKIPQNYKESLIALLEAEEQKEQLLLETNKLREEVGFSKEYATVKRMEHHFKKSFRWQPLKKYSKEHNLEIKKVPDVNYEFVNAYHKNAWYNAYDINLETLF